VPFFLLLFCNIIEVSFTICPDPIKSLDLLILGGFMIPLCQIFLKNKNSGDISNSDGT